VEALAKRATPNEEPALSLSKGPMHLAAAPRGGWPTLRAFRRVGFHETWAAHASLDFSTLLLGIYAFIFHQLGVPLIVQLPDSESREQCIPYLVDAFIDSRPVTVKVKIRL